MHITTRTSLAMKALMFCATYPEVTVKRREIAKVLGGSENHLAQVIHMLGQAGYLTTLRGRAGGLKLARNAASITVGEVFRTFEKVLPFSDCLGNAEAKCTLAGACRLTGVLNEALEGFYAHLDRVTLADLTEGNTALARYFKAA